MLIEYIEEAMKNASYEMIEDEEPFYGEIPLLPGVWATGKNLEACRTNLKETVEGWILLSIRKGFDVPEIHGFQVKAPEEIPA